MPAKKKTRDVKQAKKKSPATSAARFLNLPLVLSLGVLSFAEEQVSDFVESLTKRGEKTEKAGRKYLKKLMKTGSEKAKQAPKKIEKKVEKEAPKEEWILRALHRLNIPTHNDLAALDKRVDALLKRVA
jgi:poly(hydroxyalkanoate) granule-associated protein